jgi:hypothetical protein
MGGGRDSCRAGEGRAAPRGAKGRVVGQASAITTLKPPLRPVNRSAGAPVSLASWTPCPFYTFSSSPLPISSYFSNVPTPRPYQPPPQYLPFSGSISQAFFKAPQPLPSGMLPLAMITLPVPSSFSVVNPKAAFLSNGPTCVSFLPSFLVPFPFLIAIFPSLNLDTLTWSTPSPQGGTSAASPPPRSAAIGGGDFAAS